MRAVALACGHAVGVCCFTSGVNQRQHAQRAARAVENLQWRGHQNRPGSGKLIQVGEALQSPFASTMHQGVAGVGWLEVIRLHGSDDQLPLLASLSLPEHQQSVAEVGPAGGHETAHHCKGLVLLHGGMGSANNFGHQVRALLTAGFRVIVVDSRGQALYKDFADYIVRHERRPGSRYAALENCRYEINEAESMMRREGIAWLSSTHKSIEEIATTILRDIRPDRLIY